MKPKIIVIGTCRVHHPIRKMSENLDLLNDSNQGFVHTSSEVIQRIKHLSGEYEYLDEVSNFQLNGQSASLISGETIQNADIVFIEISSQKIIKFHEHNLQLNNLMNHVKSFDKEVSEKWISQLRTAWNNNSKITEMGPEDFPASISLDDRKVLSSSTAKIQSNLELEQDIDEIYKLTNGKVIFVTHVDATPPNGIKIVSRTKLINSIIELCQKKNIPCINPTELLEENSPKLVLEKNGEDINHYNSEFLSQVGEFFVGKITNYLN